MAHPHTARGPGPVAVVHRLLIATGLAGAAFYTVWEVREYTGTGRPGALVAAALALAATVGLAIYLRSLRGLAAKLTPDDRQGRS